MAFSTSLSYALENSLKLWQSSYTPLQSGLVSKGSSAKLSTDSSLGAALDSRSLDYPMAKDISSPSTVRISSASRTTSPSTTATASSALPLSSGVDQVYSCKVFVGGLPPDIVEDGIHDRFNQFGTLSVLLPRKAQSKGYAFLIFQDELSVHQLIKVCHFDDGKLYMFVSSVTQTNKKVQICPWKLSGSNYTMDHAQPIDRRKTIFIFIVGVPRTLKACELADIFNSRYGNVGYVSIYCDRLKYPKRAGKVTFSSHESFMRAISCRLFQVTYGDIYMKVEVKPYILDHQVCDECRGMNCEGHFAPFFCDNIHCLRYYCEQCWISSHSAPGTQDHRCFKIKERAKPRAINFISHFHNRTHHPLV